MFETFAKPKCSIIKAYHRVDNLDFIANLHNAGLPNKPLSLQKSNIIDKILEEKKKSMRWNNGRCTMKEQGQLCQNLKIGP